MNNNRPHETKFILLSNLKALKNIPDVHFSENDKLWIIPVCCMAKTVTDHASFEAFFLMDGGEGMSDRKILLDKGAEQTNIATLNYYDVIDDECIQNIISSQCIIFTGGRMELGLERMRKVGLDRALQNYSGIVIGVSAGALMLFSEYIITPNRYYKNLEICEGLGYIDGEEIMIEVHFTEDDLLQVQCVELTCDSRKQTVHAIREEGYMMVQNNGIISCNGVREFVAGKDG